MSAADPVPGLGCVALYLHACRGTRCQDWSVWRCTYMSAAGPGARTGLCGVVLTCLPWDPVPGLVCVALYLHVCRGTRCRDWSVWRCTYMSAAGPGAGTGLCGVVLTCLPRDPVPGLVCVALYLHV